MYCKNKPQLFHEYSSILRKLDVLNCKPLELNSEELGAGDFAQETESKFSFSPKKEPEEKSSMISLQENQNCEIAKASHILEFYALILSIISLILGYCLTVSYSGIEILMNISKTMIISSINELWSEGSEPFLLNFENFKKLIIKTYGNYNCWKALVISCIMILSIIYVLMTIILQINKILLFKIPISK